MTSRILLVEDEADIAVVVSDLLRRQGYTVESVGDGTAGLKRALEGSFDLVILDVLLPDFGGLDLCRHARERGFEGAVLMLTARDQVSDRVEGLRRGADDYMVKPFSPEELVARTEALLRRVHKVGVTPVMVYQFGDVSVDFVRLKLLKKGAPLSLSAKEWDLLRYLVNHRGQVSSRETLLEHVWPGQTFTTLRTVDVHIAWLRQKLENDPKSPVYIVTMRGKGYLFAAQPSLVG